MSKFNITEQAYFDLQMIWSYHCNYSPEIADKIENIIFEKINLIVDHPLFHPLREDLTQKPYRFSLVQDYGYFIIYDPTSNPINIIRIISSKRDINAQIS